jgi:ribose transport system ATP-binding protein
MEVALVARPSNAESAALAARGIVKSFGPTRALRGVDLTLRRAEIHALLGGNGAGKSTLIKIISGELAPDSGEITADLSGGGDQVTVVHQELSIMRDLTVTENLFVGATWGGRPFPWRSGAVRAREVLANLGLDDRSVQPSTRASTLPLHQLQLVEIGRALASDSRVVLLDEPTAALTAQETNTLFAVLRRLRDRGTSFVFVSHRMEEIRRIADRMTIIRDGVTVVDGVAVEDITDAEVLHNMFGRSLPSGNPAVDTASDPANATGSSAQADAVGRETVVELAHPTLPHPVVVRAGDVIGLAGTPVGPQRLLEALLGDRRGSRWRIELADARRGAPRSVRDALLRGIGYVSGDRADKGVFPDLSIYDNTALARQVVTRGRFHSPRVHRRVDVQADRLGFAHQDLRAQPSSLSGGTQQKFLLARWLDLPVRLLLLEEPTRGVDLHTKQDLYRIVHELAASGCAVIWWSTEYAELKQTCDRVLAFDIAGDPVDVLEMDQTVEQDLLLATGTA